MPHTTTKGTGEDRTLIRRGYDGDISHLETEVSISGGYVVITSPHLDKPIKISSITVDKLAAISNETESAYFVDTMQIEEQED